MTYVVETTAGPVSFSDDPNRVVEIIRMLDGRERERIVPIVYAYMRALSPIDRWMFVSALQKRTT